MTLRRYFSVGVGDPSSSDDEAVDRLVIFEILSFIDDVIVEVVVTVPPALVVYGESEQPFLPFNIYSLRYRVTCIDVVRV